VQQFQITIDNSGESYRCGAEMHLLEAMERALCCGIPVGCRNGGCGACKVHVTDGRYATRKMNRAVLSAQEQAEGFVLACKTFPQSDLKVTAVGASAPRSAVVHRGTSFSFGFATTPVLQPDKES